MTAISCLCILINKAAVAVSQNFADKKCTIHFKLLLIPYLQCLITIAQRRSVVFFSIKQVKLR